MAYKNIFNIFDIYAYIYEVGTIVYSIYRGGGILNYTETKEFAQGPITSE